MKKNQSYFMGSNLTDYNRGGAFHRKPGKRKVMNLLSPAEISEGE